MRTLLLDSRISSTNIADLAQQLGACNSEEGVHVDLSNVRFFELIPMTLLLGKLKGWVQDGKVVKLTDPARSRIGPYMQRMDFYRQCGIEAPEEFTRHNAQGRFLEFKGVQSGSTSQASNIATKVADVLAPDQAVSDEYNEIGFYDSLEYSVSELVLNTVQHAKGNGYVGAQYYGSRDEVQLAIADTGIGIWASFTDSGSPVASSITSDADALCAALQNGVSCTAHFSSTYCGEGANAGVGLTFLSELARTTGGEFMIMSGEWLNSTDKLLPLGTDCGYHGTFSAFSFPRSQLDGFHAVMDTVKSKYLGSDIELEQFEKVFK